MRWAVLADIHGNAEALHAVLGDLDGLGGADRLAVLGDVVMLGPHPGECAELLLDRDAVGVFGNTDHFLLRRDWSSVESRDAEEEADRDLCLWTLKQLSARAMTWLRALPFQQELNVEGQQVSLVHASPRGVADAITAETADEVIADMLADLEADLLLFGHTHQPLDRSLAGVRLINPGAVGFPQGEPATARYTLIDWDSTWHVDFRSVSYDVEATIAALLAARRPYRRWVAETLRRASHLPVETFD